MRFLTRSALASYFVVDGVQALTNPESLVEQARPMSDRVVEWADQALPASIASRLPRSTTTWVRIHGSVQTLGALMMATGIGRRCGAGLLAAAYLPKLMMFRRDDGLVGSLKDLALLGGVLVEAGDTQGKPSWAWQSAANKRERKRAAKRTTKTVRTTPATVSPVIDAARLRREAQALKQALTTPGGQTRR
jgi:uncharacterized membrane protein YphA (DoxX/SURF4 family)